MEKNESLNESLVETRILVQKGNDAMAQAMRNKPDDSYIKFIDAAIKRTKTVLETKFLAEDIIDGRQGVFLFNDDKRYAVFEVWITTDGKVIEVLRINNKVKEIDATYIYNYIGTKRFVNGIANAMDELTKRKKAIADDNDSIEDKIKAMFGF